ncbi:MAG: hypothetical protein CMJ81_04500 [Planctomycetaceae bacterium]|nr:hypothetical protein [Planctomycetaceae bacterium]MBP60402.1 hypothetical protein [Planctomycetaceae bacterium]
MIREFVSPGDPRWQAVLEATRHDVYHLPEYVLHAAKHEGGTPLAFFAQAGDEFFLVPVLKRALPETLVDPRPLCDASSPYGYPGPLTNCNDPARLELFFAACIEAAAELQICTLFLRQNPLLSLPELRLGSNVDVTTHGPTVYVDLAQNDEELAGNVRSGHRYEIRKLIKEGFHVVMDQWQTYAEFITSYAKTMNRVSAGERYYFSDDYFWDLKQQLGPWLHFGVVCTSGGQYVAGSLFTETGGIVQYHLSATVDEFHRKSPTKLLLQQAITWARQRGNRYFHLGGGLGAQEDSLFRFKAGFSKSRSNFSTMRVVVQPAEYGALNRRWLQQNPHTPPRPGFFPFYRQEADPVPSHAA